MNRVIYEINDGTKTSSYKEALEKKEAGYSYITTYVYESDLFYNKIKSDSNKE